MGKPWAESSVYGCLRLEVGAGRSSADAIKGMAMRPVPSSKEANAYLTKEHRKPSTLPKV